jgi:hypothetical protein
MMAKSTEIRRQDILSMDEYGASRKERRQKVTALKRNRRVAIGPDATFYFESYDTMFHQIHEMLWIEKGGEEQIDDELAAYNPLIPNGQELVATVMIEIDDPARRARLLGALGGFEETIFIAFDGQKSVMAVPEDDLDRTTADGKASSVQFVHFPIDADAAIKLKDPGVQVTLGIDHPAYGHVAILNQDVRTALTDDLA